jgi:lambda family phage minor tail protein L
MSPSPVDSFSIIEKNELVSANIWIWLYEIEVPTSPPTRYRFCRNTRQVTFRGNIYYPFPVSHSGMRENQSGDLPTVNLVVSNVSREVMSVLETYNGLLDQPVRIILVNSAALETNQAVMQQDFKIVNVTATEESITASLGDISLYETTVPQQRMMRNYCRHQYRSAACGYAVDPGDPNFLSGCDKSYDGTNGCIAHGASEADAGVPVVHPQRFGGFRGIPISTTQGSI